MSLAPARKPRDLDEVGVLDRPRKHRQLGNALGRHTDHQVLTYPTGELCMASLLIERPDFVVLDFHLDGIEKGAMDGLATLDQIKLVNQKLPVVMLSSQDKIEVAISCMHHGALDYVVKSETAMLRIEKSIAAFFRFQKMEGQLNWYMARM